MKQIDKNIPKMFFAALLMKPIIEKIKNFQQLLKDIFELTIKSKVQLYLCYLSYIFITYKVNKNTSH